MFSKTLRMSLRERQSCCSHSKIPLLCIGHTSQGMQRVCFPSIQKMGLYHLEEEENLQLRLFSTLVYIVHDFPK
jgi:hypothetical protein